MDSVLFDGQNLFVFDKLGIGFISTGKMYDGAKEHVDSQMGKKMGEIL